MLEEQLELEGGQASIATRALECRRILPRTEPECPAATVAAGSILGVDRSGTPFLWLNNPLSRLLYKLLKSTECATFRIRFCYVCSARSLLLTSGVLTLNPSS